MFTKVLNVEGERTVRYSDSFGDVFLYPQGTVRTVKKLTLKGWKIIKQIATLHRDADWMGSVILYNKWRKMLTNSNGEE